MDITTNYYFLANDISLAGYSLVQGLYLSIPFSIIIGLLFSFSIFLRLYLIYIRKDQNTPLLTLHYLLKIIGVWLASTYLCFSSMNVQIVIEFYQFTCKQPIQTKTQFLVVLNSLFYIFNAENGLSMDYVSLSFTLLVNLLNIMQFIFMNQVNVKKSKSQMGSSERLRKQADERLDVSVQMDESLSLCKFKQMLKNSQKILIISHDLQVVDMNFKLSKYLIRGKEAGDPFNLFLSLPISYLQGSLVCFATIHEYLDTPLTSAYQQYVACMVQKNPYYDFKDLVIVIYKEAENVDYMIHLVEVPLTSNSSFTESTQTLHQLSQSLSHELGTNLNSILTYSTIALTDPEIPELVKRNYLVPIQTNSEFLAMIVSNIRDLQLIQLNQFTLKLEEFDVLESIFQVDRLFRDILFNKQIRLIHDLNLQNQILVNDKQRFKQIYFQIMQNAVKFTQTGEIKVKIEISQQSCQVSVTDSGIGLTSDEYSNMNKLLRCSDHLIKVSKNSVGSGIGLKTSNILVQKMNHQRVPITCQKLDKGTCFTFFVKNNLKVKSQKSSQEYKFSASSIKYIGRESYFESSIYSSRQMLAVSSRFKYSLELQSSVSGVSDKLQVQEISSIPMSEDDYIIQSPPQFQTNFKNMRNSIITDCCSQVLIVDDEYFNIQCLKMILSKFHFRCDYAYNGEEALAQIEKKKRKKDRCECRQNSYLLYFIDINMPIMDGYDTVKAIKEMMMMGQIDKGWCIANTGFCDLETKLKSYQCGMDFFLLKPLNIKLIEEMIKTLLPIK